MAKLKVGAIADDKPGFREIAAYGIDGAATKTLRNTAQKRRRERASSRMKATNRPTAGSSASGLHTSSDLDLGVLLADRPVHDAGKHNLGCGADARPRAGGPRGQPIQPRERDGGRSRST
jgi:hypothetical protein